LCGASCRAFAKIDSIPAGAGVFISGKCYADPLSCVLVLFTYIPFKNSPEFSDTFISESAAGAAVRCGFLHTQEVLPISPQPALPSMRPLEWRSGQKVVPSLSDRACILRSTCFRTSTRCPVRLRLRLRLRLHVVRQNMPAEFEHFGCSCTALRVSTTCLRHRESWFFFLYQNTYAPFIGSTWNASKHALNFAEPTKLKIEAGKCNVRT